MRKVRGLGSPRDSCKSHSQDTGARIQHQPLWSWDCCLSSSLWPVHTHTGPWEVGSLCSGKQGLSPRWASGALGSQKRQRLLSPGGWPHGDLGFHALCEAEAFLLVPRMSLSQPPRERQLLFGLMCSGRFSSRTYKVFNQTERGPGDRVLMFSDCLSLDHGPCRHWPGDPDETPFQTMARNIQAQL